MSILNKTIKEIHESLVNKEITPLELTKEAINRAKEDTNNAFEYIMEEEALKIASELGEPEKDNIFWGIPFGIKDNFSTKDVPTTGSSNILNGYVPLFNATVVQKLLDLKAIPIAKTTLDELAMGGTGMSGHKGWTFNPYDPSHTRMVGGSSCGSAASVSACIYPFALGSDTGDSVRKPASFAGLVGFKPTWGRISRYGLFPFAPSLDHVAFFSRSVDDSADILNALAGHDENDITSSWKPVENYKENIDCGLKNKKIVVIKEILDSISDKDVLKAFNDLIAKVKEAGSDVEFRSFNKQLLEVIFPTYFIISCAEATSNNANLDGIKFGPYHESQTYQEEVLKARTEGFGELIKRRFVIGSFSLMKENQQFLYLRAKKCRHMIVDELARVMDGCDALLLPAAPGIASKFEGTSDKLSDEYLIADNHLALGNFSGYPSLTLPICLIDGMPYGVNVMSHAFDEKNVLQVSKGIEKITGLYNLNAKEVK